MIVTRSDLELLIEEVRAEVVDPRLGIYGPGSMSWQVDKEIILYVGGGEAALLQLAHPYVAHAVDQHSAARRDTLGRFQRTFENVWCIVFGDLETALGCARRVHSVHRRIEGEILEDVGAFRRGHRYHANDPEALLWVHATLMHTAVQVYELCVRPLTLAEKDRYIREGSRFARLFGIDRSLFADSWDGFDDYFRRTLESDQIAIGQPARELAEFLFKSPRPVFQPFFDWLAIMTAGLLPTRLRGELALDFGWRERFVFNGSVGLLRRGYPLLPRRLRYVPAYVRAHRRLHGLTEHDRIGDLIERLATAPLAQQRRRKSPSLAVSG